MNEIEESVIAKIRERRDAGRRKYGTTMERTDLSTRHWLVHAQEEAMDLAIYLEKIIRDDRNVMTDESLRHARKVELEYRGLLETANRADLEALAMLLIQKRAVDGLNGRQWNAGAHLFFEDAVVSILSLIKNQNTK